MNILEQIISDKRKEIIEFKAQKPINEFENSILFSKNRFSLKEFIKNSNLSGIIAEFKRKSPSKGVINQVSDVIEVTQAYVAAGASALSILTNEHYFGGKIEDILLARSMNAVPILRKEFIVDEFQIIESKAIGADAILLIAASLSSKEIFNFAKLAKSIDLEVLLEIHEESELNSLNEYVDIVGVNNRNLKTFQTDLLISKQLAPKIPPDFVKISESGLHLPEHLLELQQFEYQGFLIGERFMSNSNPGKAFSDFVKMLKV